MRTRAADGSAAPDGILVVDKPAGWTSHDVVARLRRLLATRRVGHAGTLDPMATGVLVVGVERGTRLLGFLSAAGKTYEATIRLGQTTTTDDADGQVTASVDIQGVDLPALREVFASFVGTSAQVPPAVSAVKVGGRRAYSRVRAGEVVELPARLVTIHHLELRAARQQVVPVPTPNGGPGGEQRVLDADVVVDCSSGTYIRALARDVGRRLGVGGHLTALRRTRVGPFQLAEAHSLRELADAPPARAVLSLAAAAARVFPVRLLTEEETVHVGHGRSIQGRGEGATPTAGLSPDGRLVALLVAGPSGQIRPSVVFAPAAVTEAAPDISGSQELLSDAPDCDAPDCDARDCDAPASGAAGSGRCGISSADGTPDVPGR